jgi:hypothetical protein
MIRNVPLFVPPFYTPRQYRTLSSAAQIDATNGFSKKWENLQAAFALQGHPKWMETPTKVSDGLEASYELWQARQTPKRTSKSNATQT